MKSEIIKINGKDFTKITAESGMTFCRVHDQFVMGNEIILGVDYSTGIARTDLPEYYEEVMITISNDLVDRVNELEITQNNIIDVINERGLL